MAGYDLNYIEAAHKHSGCHYEEIKQSKLCGCFYCLTILKPEEITEWLEEPNEKGLTAFCPNCDIDAVIGDKSGLPVTDIKFLKEMQEYWFS